MIIRVDSAKEYLQLARTENQSVKVGNVFIGVESINRDNLITLRIYASRKLLNDISKNHPEYNPSINRFGVLTLSLYPNEGFDLREDVHIAVFKDGSKVKIGVKAPNEEGNFVRILRSELLNNPEGRALSVWSRGAAS